jgi:hypothetical protein
MNNPVAARTLLAYKDLNCNACSPAIVLHPVNFPVFSSSCVNKVSGMGFAFHHGHSQQETGAYLIMDFPLGRKREEEDGRHFAHRQLSAH